MSVCIFVIQTVYMYTRRYY